MKALSLLLALLLTACSSTSSYTDRFELANMTYYRDSEVIRGDMQVMIHPNQNMDVPPTALFVPLGLTQEMNSARSVSKSISMQVWQSFLEEQTFPVLELAETTPPYRVQQALPMAKAKGAQMLVGGYITYFLDGGDRGDTRISIQIEVYNVATGDLIWSVAHAGLLPYEKKKDYYVLEVKTRMPFDPTNMVVSAISKDMAKLIHYWTDPSTIAQDHPGKGKAF